MIILAIFTSLYVTFGAFKKKTVNHSKKGAECQRAGVIVLGGTGGVGRKGFEYHLCRQGGVWWDKGQAHTLQEESFFVSSVQGIGTVFGRICQLRREDTSASLSHMMHRVSHACRNIHLPKHTAPGCNTLRPKTQRCKCPGQNHWTSHSQSPSKINL